MTQFWLKKLGRILIPPVTQLFKWLKYYAQCTERKNWVILTLKVESLAELKFDPKSWVTGGTKIWPNFLGQNDSIFLPVLQ